VLATKPRQLGEKALHRWAAHTGKLLLKLRGEHYPYPLKLPELRKVASCAEQLRGEPLGTYVVEALPRHFYHSLHLLAMP
jgi:hypothetical protein